MRLAMSVKPPSLPSALPAAVTLCKPTKPPAAAVAAALPYKLSQALLLVNKYPKNLQTKASSGTCTSSCSFRGLLSMRLAMSVKPPSLPAARSLLLSLFVSQPNQLLPLWLLLPSCLLPLG
jgi:hypothetical protein